jgi:hypothetical protein
MAFLRLSRYFGLAQRFHFCMIRGMTVFVDFMDENAQGAPSKISWHFPLILLIFWSIFLGPSRIDKNIAVFILFSNYLLSLFFIATHLTILKGSEIICMMNISFRSHIRLSRLYAFWIAQDAPPLLQEKPQPIIWI